MPSRILQVDAKIVLFTPFLLFLYFPLCRDASQPQNSTEIPLQLQPQKREPGNGLDFGRRRAPGCQRGGWGGEGGRSGESAGHSLGGGGTLDLGGLKDRGPQEETFTGEMGLGLLWAWSWVGKSCAAWASPTEPPVGLTRLGWGWMEASLPWSGSPRAQWSSWKEPQGRLLPRPAQEALHTGTGRRVLEW